MEELELELVFHHADKLKEFESFLYSVNGSYWDTVKKQQEAKKKAAAHFHLTFTSAQNLYTFGYSWAAHQWSVDKAKYAKKVAA